MSIDLDFESSIVTLAERRFPTVGLICPQGPEQSDSRYQRSLGPHALMEWCWVYIPAENGILVYLSAEKSTCRLYARTCTLDSYGGLWLPHDLFIAGGRIQAGNWMEWTGCEPDWLVEHIDRVSGLPYDEPPGPKVELLRLAEYQELLDNEATDVV